MHTPANRAHQRSLGRNLTSILVYCVPPIAMNVRMPKASEIKLDMPSTHITSPVATPVSSALVGNAIVRKWRCLHQGLAPNVKTPLYPCGRHHACPEKKHSWPRTTPCYTQVECRIPLINCIWISIFNSQGSGREVSSQTQVSWQYLLVKVRGQIDVALLCRIQDK